MIAALINHLWQSTLFCGGVWLITLALRDNSAALRHWIWLLASLKFLVPFSLLFLASFGPFYNGGGGDGTTTTHTHV